MLRLTRAKTEGLERPDYLGDYDAIVLEPMWGPMFDHPVEPGSRDGTPALWIRDLQITLERRSAELRAFFAIGGILVVYAVEPSWLDSEETDYDRPIMTIETHSWFLGHIQPQLARRDAAGGLLMPGRGKPVRVVEPGHPFADYLAQRNAYVARISDVVRMYANTVVLAENRAGEPVAAAFEIERGSLLLVPPPESTEDSAALELALQDALDARLIERHWTLEAERDLVARFDEVLTDLRAVRDDMRQRLAEIRSAKAEIFDDVHVRRAIGYWDGATRPGTPAARAFQELYRMQEMVEQLLGGGEKNLAAVLGLPLSRLKSLKKMANRPEYDFRHATIGDPERAPSAEIQAALEDARAVVQAFIEYRYRSLRDRTANPDGTPGPKA